MRQLEAAARQVEESAQRQEQEQQLEEGEIGEQEELLGKRSLGDIEGKPISEEEARLMQQRSEQEERERKDQA